MGKAQLPHNKRSCFPPYPDHYLKGFEKIPMKSTASNGAFLVISLFLFSCFYILQACKKGHKNVVEALLRHGVNTKAQSTHELTAEQIALKNQHFEIQNLLSDHEERFVTFTLLCKDNEMCSMYSSTVAFWFTTPYDWFKQLAPTRTFSTNKK